MEFRSPPQALMFLRSAAFLRNPEAPPLGQGAMGPGPPLAQGPRDAAASPPAGPRLESNENFNQEPAAGTDF